MRQHPRCIFRVLAGLLRGPLQGRARRSTTRRSHPITARRAPRILVLLTVVVLGGSRGLLAQSVRASDPGVRGGPAGAGGPYDPAYLTDEEQQMFEVGLADFSEDEEVEEGVGPRFNFVGCAGCHSQPAVGGTSPAVNPLFRMTGELAPRLQFTGNMMPSFITRDGPIREARFKFQANGDRDGGVHALFVITGHPAAADCNIRQEDFEAQLRNNNIVFRIPTPVFGAGLIEQILDSAILANLAADASAKHALGIGGRPNRNGNDGRIARFGWKAQNQSLLLFSGEAYNVEMGITNELFQQERDETPSCQFATVPNDVTPSVGQIGAIANFANFQRFLAPPTPVTSFGNVSAASISRGRQQFTNVGCVHCHTPTLETADNTTVAALANQNVNLFSDLALHAMGPGLADDILQGAARGDEFRTAPLWGLGKRIFFLHDGRTTDLVEAILAHRSNGNQQFGASEANKVIDNFDNLEEDDKQSLLNFLRSL
jgi:CxxC motif-containing protein (DUF1111 family)